MMPIQYPPPPMDASQIQFTMPTSLPVRPKSRVLDILKLVIGLIIALVLAAILAVLIFVPRTGSAVDLRESNEKIAKLERESNENIARLEREQAVAIENEREVQQKMLLEQQFLKEMQRIKHQENLTERYRLEDQLIEQQHRQEDFQHAMDQSSIQSDMEQKRYQLLLEEHQLAEQHRQEDLNRNNAELVSKFIEEVIFTPQPIDRGIVGARVKSLIRRLDPFHKSLLIENLYKAKFLSTADPNNPPLDLQGANLKDLDLDGIDTESGQIGPLQNYSQLALPSTNLINASLDQLDLDGADFSSSDMLGISFRSSRVLGGNFSHSQLSLSNFQGADVSRSHFSYAIIHNASFENAKLFQTQMNNVNIGSTNFQFMKAIEANFSQSELSNSDFQQADLSYARMDYTSARSANFYFMKAMQTNFTHAYLPDCSFQWADLRESSFRYAVLPSTNFENANVQNVDFTRAFLAGARITAGQLDVALSITNATLPDGSIGKNKNLLKNGHAQCSNDSSTIADWSIAQNVFTNENQLNSDCVFQASAANAVLKQSIDINRFSRLIKDGQAKVYIEMQFQTNVTINSSPYMNITFLNSQNIQTGADVSSLNLVSLTLLPKFSATFPCPLNTVVLEFTIILREENTTVDNIHVTIET